MITIVFCNDEIGHKIGFLFIKTWSFYVDIG